MAALPENTLAELIRYNNWANRQVLAACEGLSEARLAAETPGAYGSIRDTLGHIIRSEAFYIELLTGTKPQPPFDWDSKPGVAEMSAYAEQVAGALENMLNHVRPGDLVHEEWKDGQADYQALAIYIQIINHAVEHRTNITTIRNQVELSPPGVDGWAYLETHPDRFDYVKASGAAD